jgi:hypothetical protein
MRDGNVRLARPIPQHAADAPATREARVEYQCPIDHRYQGADILAEPSQRNGRICQHRRVITGHLQSSSCEIDTPSMVCSWIRTPTTSDE